MPHTPEQRKEFRRLNLDKMIAREKAYREANREKIAATKRMYNERMQRDKEASYQELLDFTATPVFDQPVVLRGFHAHDIDHTVCNATRSSRRKRSMIAVYKLGKGCESGSCAWCGDFTSEMLVLDHIDPKTKNERLKKGIGFPSLSWDDLIAEISKCKVLCHNCHSKRTIEEGHHINYMENK
jgi:5-methylcytosine-specific restriction endonuclease McrA